MELGVHSALIGGRRAQDDYGVTLERGRQRDQGLCLPCRGMKPLCSSKEIPLGLQKVKDLTLPPADNRKIRLEERCFVGALHV